MKQLLILSGKGGTGKTTVASSFVALSGTRAFADCDVDAPNLHLSTQVAAEPAEADFNGFPRAVVDPAKCTSCGACQDACRLACSLFRRRQRESSCSRYRRPNPNSDQCRHSGEGTRDTVFGATWHKP